MALIVAASFLAIRSSVVDLLQLSSLLDLTDDFIEPQVQHMTALFGVIPPPKVEALKKSNCIDWAKGFCQSFDPPLSDLISASYVNLGGHSSTTSQDSLFQ
jgi:hypothetical protein